MFFYCLFECIPRRFNSFFKKGASIGHQRVFLIYTQIHLEIQVFGNTRKYCQLFEETFPSLPRCSAPHRSLCLVSVCETQTMTMR